MTDLNNFPTDPLAKEMLQMVSPIYDKAYVGKWLYQILGAGLRTATEAIQSLREEAFPETATETLPLWEDLYGITPPAGATVEQRRTAVLLKRNSRHTVTPGWLSQYLENLTGRECDVIEHTDSYSFSVRIGSGESEYQIRDVIRELDALKPAHLSYDIIQANWN